MCDGNVGSRSLKAKGYISSAYGSTGGIVNSSERLCLILMTMVILLWAWAVPPAWRCCRTHLG